jgi:hypothetical protein
MKWTLFFIAITLSCLTVQAQDKSRIDSMFLAKIPFDSSLAKQDLKKGTVRLLDIFSPTWGTVGTRFDQMIEPYQLDLIEKQFGFKNELIVIDSVFSKYTELREFEYNQVVIQYLDSINGIDFWSEYKKQIANTYMKNRDHCGTFLAELELKADTTEVKSNFTNDHRKIGYISSSAFPVEIRYYYTPSLSNGGSVIIIQCVDKQFEAKKIDYWFNPKKTWDNRKVNKVEVTKLTPVDSWESFFDSLTSLNFFNFPTMEVISPKMKITMQLEDGRTVEKRSMITDGANYTYQIKIDDKVRTFSYHSPMSWYRTYDFVEELKIADDIRHHFVTNLKTKERR